MTYLHTAPTPYVLADLVPRRALTDTALVVSGAALTALAAQVSFALPGTPVPVTAQTAAVLLTAGALGARRGVMAQLLYLLVGIAGVPVFTDGGSGAASVLGATGGYLVAFPIAAWVVGSLAARGLDRRLRTSLLPLVAGSLVFYAVGVPWLALYADVSLAKACSMGLWPFLIGDAFKALVVAFGAPGAWRLASRYDRS
jgi:biotin transport system substrate-specific component